MKKIYLLLFFCCLAVIGSAQTTRDTLYDIGTTGSYKSGNVTSTTRTSGNIITKDSTQRGWAVFNLGGIPAGTIIDSCTIGFNVSAYGGAGTPSGWKTYGYHGDLSTIPIAAALFADCILDTLLTTDSYGTAVGTQTLTSTAAMQAFASSSVGDSASICWTGGGTRVYTITGTSGSHTLSGAHMPYMILTYCTGVTNLAATANDTNLCSGSTLHLTTSGSGTTTYSWTGPNSFTSALENPSFVVDTNASGVYSLTAYNSGGCATSVTTTNIIVSYSPAPILAVKPYVCVGQSIALLDPVSEGTWGITPATSIATISTSGVVTSISPGTIIATYACGTRKDSFDLTIRALPSAIFGTDTICEASSTILNDTSGIPHWSSSPTSIATVNSIGKVTGIAGGMATITYTDSSTTCYTTTSFQVNPIPSPIIGTLDECVAQTTSLSDTALYGTWASSDTTKATIDSTSGIVTGIVAGSVIITYTTGCGSVYAHDTVKRLPAPITGLDSVCLLGYSSLSDDTVGGKWTSNDTTIAMVSLGSSTIHGVSAGSTTITYTGHIGCFITTPFTVIHYPDSIKLPAPPLTACIKEKTYLFDDTLGGTWSTSGTAIATITAGSGILTGLHAGTVTVNYTTRPGCTVSATIQVSSPPPPISGIKTICPGSFDTLSDTETGGLWKSSKPSVATIGDSSGIVAAISGGSDTISYTAPTGCTSSSFDSVYPRPVPVIHFDTPAVSFTVLPDTNGFTGYQWYTGTSPKDTTILPGATSYNLAALYNEYYYVVVTDTLGCIGTSAVYPLDLTFLGVKSIGNNNNVIIYPNPATAILYINTSLSLHAIICDVTGRVVIDQLGQKQIDISKLANGIYTISFYNNSDQDVAVEKFVKE